MTDNHDTTTELLDKIRARMEAAKKKAHEKSALAESRLNAGDIDGYLAGFRAARAAVEQVNMLNDALTLVRITPQAPKVIL